MMLNLRRYHQCGDLYVNQFILVLPNTDRLSDVINFAVLGNYTDYVVWVHWVHPGRVWVHLGAALSNVGLDKKLAP